MLNHHLIEQYSEMYHDERTFILDSIALYKPKKILEIGVAAGANAVLILDYLHKNNQLGIQFHSSDYYSTYYRDIKSKTQDTKRTTGFLVDMLVPDLKPYWNLHLDGFVANHLDNIGHGIDLCIIDTVHSAPGEALDFLMVLPFLKRNAVIILHDLTFHINLNVKHSNICALLFLALQGKKHIPTYPPYAPHFQNIGCCVLDDYDKQQRDTYFRILNLPWSYMPSASDLALFIQHITKHYGDEYAEFIHHIIPIQQQWLKPKDSKLKKLIHKFMRYKK